MKTLLRLIHKIKTATNAPRLMVIIRSHPSSVNEILVKNVAKTYPEFRMTKIVFFMWRALLRSRRTSTKVSKVKKSE